MEERKMKSKHLAWKEKDSILSADYFSTIREVP